MFFWNYEEITLKYEALNLGYILCAFLIIFSFILCSTMFGVNSILWQQMYYTYNDLTYLERRKEYDTEVYLPFYSSKDNEFYMV
jgi:hypothetical protein